MFFQIKIISKNTCFLPCYDPHHVDQLLKPYGALGQLSGNLEKNLLSIRKSYKVLKRKRAYN